MADPTLLDRVLGGIRAIVQTIIGEENLTYAGIFEYTIDSVSGAIPNVTVSAHPSDPGLALPPVANIAMVSSTTGGASIPSPGQPIYLFFANRDPSKPKFVAGAPTFAQVSLDGSGQSPVARVGDTVTIASGTTIAGAIGGVMAGPGVTGAIVTSAPFTATITQGNPKVTA